MAIDIRDRVRAWSPRRLCAGVARRAGALACVLVGVLALAAPPAAPPPPLPDESLDVVTLGPPGPHWLWANDFGASVSRLFDADTGRMLGALQITPFTSALEWNPLRGEVMFAGTYYSRGTRGERTNTVGVYSLRELAPVGEAVLPQTALASGVPLRAYSGLLDGGRLMLVYNLTPAMSVGVVDVLDRAFVGELSTPGCGLVLPAGASSFLQLCANGTAQRVTLDLMGREQARASSEPFFDAVNDPLMDKAARDGDLWWFVSFAGKVQGLSGQTLVPLEPFTLQGNDRHDAKWRAGGYAPIALHRESRRLFVLMHEGGADTHKDPGTEVWVFDLEARKRVLRIELHTPAMSIDVSQDGAPLLYAANPALPQVEVYAATDGRLLRTIGETGHVILLQALTGERGGDAGR